MWVLARLNRFLRQYLMHPDASFLFLRRINFQNRVALGHDVRRVARDDAGADDTGMFGAASGLNGLDRFRIVLDDAGEPNSAYIVGTVDRPAAGHIPLPRAALLTVQVNPVVDLPPPQIYTIALHRADQSAVSRNPNTLLVAATLKRQPDPSIPALPIEYLALARTRRRGGNKKNGKNRRQRPETSHAQAQMDEREENDRDFSIDAKMQDVRGVSAAPPEAP
jgi:hypothetical protein